MNTKIWPQAKEVAEEVNLLSNLKSIVAVLRRSGIRIFFVPHHRWEPGDYTHWKHPTTRQLAGAKNQILAKGTWAGSGIQTLSCRRVTLLSRSIGHKAALPTMTSTSS